MTVRWNRVTPALDTVAEWALAMLIFALPFSKSMVEVMIVLALTCVAIKKILKRERLFAKTPLDLALIVFIAAMIPSFFNTGYFAVSLKAFFTKALKFVVLYYLVVEIINTREKLNRFLAVALASCALILADGFVQYFVTHRDFLHVPPYPSFSYSFVTLPYPSYLGFPTASFPYPNDFASWILIFILPVGLFALMGRLSFMKRISLAAVFAALAYSLLLTKTRSAWLGFCLAVCAIPLFHARMKKVFIVLLVIIVAAPFVIKKSTIPDIISFTSVGDRKVMWENGWKIFKAHPVIGNGLNTFFKHYMKVRDDEYKDKKGSYAHNCFLQMAGDTGVVGLGAFLAMLFVFFATSVRRALALGDMNLFSLEIGLLGGIFAFLFQGFFDTNLYSLNLAALFWLSLGLSQSILKAGGA